MRAPTQHRETNSGFTLSLNNFEGPFDLLLSLISRRKLNITDVALAEVTDEFLHYIHRLFDAEDPHALDEASDFLVTAATLLELKTARLLPRESGAAPADSSLIEARDLLFARLLQFRAYRDVAEILQEKMGEEARRFPRNVALEPAFAQVLPELVFEVTPEEFAQIAARALLRPESKESPQTLAEQAQAHLREPLTTIAAEERAVLASLDVEPTQSFRALLSGVGELEIAVVRFLAVLELVRRGVVTVQQDEGEAYFNCSLNKNSGRRI